MPENLCVYCGKPISFLSKMFTDEGPVHQRCLFGYQKSKNIDFEKVKKIQSQAAASAQSADSISTRYATTKYATGLSVANVFVFFGWVVIACGALVTLGSFGNNGNVFGVLIGLSAMFCGAIVIMLAQLVKATIDTADNTRATATNTRATADRTYEILQEMRQKQD